MLDERSVVTAELDRYVSAGQQLAAIVKQVHATEAIAKQYRGKEAECFAIAMRASEVGVPIMQALGGDLFVVDGKVGMSAELMRSLAFAHGHSIDYVEQSDERCELLGTRADGATARVVWTIADADRAGLTGPTRSGNPSTWDKYPRAMLLARATSELARTLFPDVLRGVSYTREELQAIDVEGVEIADRVRGRSEAARALDPPPGWDSAEGYVSWAHAVRQACAQAVAAEPDLGERIEGRWNEAGLSWPIDLWDAELWHLALADLGIWTPRPPSNDRSDLEIDNRTDVELDPDVIERAADTSTGG